MSVPQTVAEVLSKHVLLEAESIDRMYLNVYVPQLQAVEGTLKFIRIHRGPKVASTHMVEPITRQFVDSIERFAKDNKIPLILFEKGQRKDDFAKQQRKQRQSRQKPDARPHLLRKREASAEARAMHSGCLCHWG